VGPAAQRGGKFSDKLPDVVHHGIGVTTAADAADDGTADHHGVGQGGNVADMVRRRNSEPDGDGQVSVPAYELDMLAEISGEAVAFTRDTGA
jgi:hypothetical protein